MRIHRLAILTLGAAATVTLLAACEDAGPQIEQVNDRERPETAYNAGESAAPAGGEDGNSYNNGEDGAEAEVEMQPWEGDGIAWKTPAPWTTDEGAGFRFATIHHPEDEGAAEVAVTHFGGDVGGVRANIDRWSGQVGAAPPRSDEELAELITEMEVAGVNALLVDIEGEEGLRLVALILPDQAHDRTWFFRVSGEEDAVAQTLPALKQVAETIELDRSAGVDADEG